MPADPDKPDREEIERYLLGDAQEDEELRIDEQLADKDFQALMDEVEDDLIGQYLHKRMTDSQARLFQSQLTLSTRLREKVHAAAAKLELVYFGPEEPVSTASHERRTHIDYGQMSLAAGMVLVVGFFGWRERRMSVVQSELADALRRQSARLEQIAAAKDGRDASAPVVAVFRLAIDTRTLGGGGAAPARAVVPDGVDRLRLQLNAAADAAAAYRVEVHDDAGRLIWSGAGQPRNGFVEVELPVNLIQSNDYLVRLDTKAGAGEWRPVHSYVFSVARN
jgi:hypothetical protein